MASQTKQTEQSNTAKPVIIALVVILIILVAVIAYLVGTKNASSTAPATVPPSASESAQQPTQSPQTTAKQAQNPESQPAPVVDNPKQQQVMQAQFKRQADDPRARGDVNAPVVMVEYGDFSCPMCARYEFNVSPKLQKYVDNGTLRIEWRDLSFFRDHHSEVAAAAGFAAAEQGKFWEFKRAAYQESASGAHPDWDDALIKEVAQTAGVPDLDKFMKTAKDPKTLEKVDAETATAQSLGINSTPFFIINNRFISGAWPYEHFAATIEAAAKDTKGAK